MHAAGLDFDRLGAEHHAGGIDRIRPHIRHRSRPETIRGAVVVAGDILGKHRREQPHRAELARVHDAQSLQCRRLEVQAVGDHQLGAAALRRGHDGAAVQLQGGHRLFQQHMDAGVEGRDRVLAMHPVRQRDVDRVELAAGQSLRVLLIAPGPELVALAQDSELALVAADQSRELRVAGVLHPGHEGGLRDPPSAHHRVADLVAVLALFHCCS